MEKRHFCQTGLLVGIVLQIGYAVPEKGQLGPPVQETLPDLQRIRLIGADPHGGKVQLKTDQDIRNAVMGHGGDGGDVQRLALLMEKIERRRLVLVLQLRHRLGVGQHFPPELGQLHLPGGAVKEGGAQPLFQRLDMLGQRGLPDEQPLGGGPVVLGLRQDDKILEIRNFHIAPPTRLCWPAIP